MAAKIQGVWNYKSSTNFEEYMKAVGVGMATRKMGNLAKPKVTVTINGNSLNLKSESTFRNLETSCTLGEEFDETTPDGRKCKAVIAWEGDKLVHTQRWDGKTTTITRYVDENGDLAMAVATHLGVGSAVAAVGPCFPLTTAFAFMFGTTRNSSLYFYQDCVVGDVVSKRLYSRA